MLRHQRRTDRRGRGETAQRLLSADEMRTRKRLELSGLASRVAAQKHPAQSKTLKNRSFGSDPAPQLFKRQTAKGSRYRFPETRSRARLHALYRLQWRQPDSAIRHRMRRVRHVANLH